MSISMMRATSDVEVLNQQRGRALDLLYVVVALLFAEGWVLLSGDSFDGVRVPLTMIAFATAGLVAVGVHRLMTSRRSAPGMTQRLRQSYEMVSRTVDLGAVLDVAVKLQLELALGRARDALNEVERWSVKT